MAYLLANAPPGALRSRLVARLTGMSTRQLQAWHESERQLAHRERGSRGVPRLYTWDDYQRLRMVARLFALGLSSERVWRSMEYLDRHLEGWQRLPLRRYDGDRPPHARSGRVHAAVQNGPFEVLPDAAGHETFDLALFARAGEDGPSVAASLSGMMLEGPLGRLYRFDDAIRMDPRVNVGLPTLRNSSLETSFITRLVRMSSVETVAQLYQKEPALLRRAVEFEEAA